MINNNGKYEWSNLDPFEKEEFYSLARAHFNNSRSFVDDFSEEELEIKAISIFEMNSYALWKHYYYPMGAVKLLNRYDIVIEEDGVKFLTNDGDIEESRRIKKALALLITPVTTIDRFPSALKSIESQHNYIEKEEVWSN